MKFDFPETLRNDAGRPERLSDHDPALVYISVPSVPPPTVDAGSDQTVVVNEFGLGTFTISATASGTGALTVLVDGELCVPLSASNSLSLTLTRAPGHVHVRVHGDGREQPVGIGQRPGERYYSERRSGASRPTGAARSTGAAGSTRSAGSAGSSRSPGSARSARSAGGGADVWLGAVHLAGAVVFFGSESIQLNRFGVPFAITVDVYVKLTP